jgi:hypothetical protein
LPLPRFTPWYARASGHHYSAFGRYPLIPGVDGVGRTVTGERVYFSLPRDPFGAMAEQTVVAVVLDYLWGPSAMALLKAAAKAALPGQSIRFVQIGTASELEISLPGSILRSSGLTLMGSGLGSVSNARLLERIGEVLQLAATSGLELPIRVVPLAEVTAMWSDNDGCRTVFTI